VSQCKTQSVDSRQQPADQGLPCRLQTFLVDVVSYNSSNIFAHTRLVWVLLNQARGPLHGPRLKAHLHSCTSRGPVQNFGQRYFTVHVLICVPKWKKVSFGFFAISIISMLCNPSKVIAKCNKGFKPVQTCIVTTFTVLSRFVKINRQTYML